MPQIATTAEVPEVIQTFPPDAASPARGAGERIDERMLPVSHGRMLLVGNGCVKTVGGAQIQ